MKCITAPIAVFDSGVGGIGVLRELQKALPAESFLYFGDCANAPYGEKSEANIKKIVLARAARLLCRAKALVIACNTATAAAAAEVRAGTQLPVIGMEPALLPALHVCPRPRILVLATAATLAGAGFCAQKKKAEAAGGTVIPLAAPGLVRLAEAGVLGGDAPGGYLARLFTPFRGVRFDAVVLGCTHFPFFSGALHRALGYPVRFFDGAEGTARQTKRRLAAAGLLRGGDGEMPALPAERKAPANGTPPARTPPRGGDGEMPALPAERQAPANGTPPARTPPRGGDEGSCDAFRAGNMPTYPPPHSGNAESPAPVAGDWGAGRVLLASSDPGKLPLMQALYRFSPCGGEKT